MKLPESKPSNNKVLWTSSKYTLIMQEPLIMWELMIMQGTAKWAQLDLQSIQDRDYFGHLSIFNYVSRFLKIVSNIVVLW